MGKDRETHCWNHINCEKKTKIKIKIEKEIERLNKHATSVTATILHIYAKIQIRLMIYHWYYDTNR